MKKLKGKTKKQLLDIYGSMILGRHADQKGLILLKQGKAHFHIGSSGHEAPQIAAARAMQPGKDWSYPYYRDLPFVLEWGLKPEEVFLHSLGKRQDPCSAGRQMPNHWSQAETRIVTQSAPTGVQFPQAVGCAMAAVRRGDDDVVYVASGEGTTSQGDFYEAVNWANREKLPVIFHIQNNRYAISVPYEDQAAGIPAHEAFSSYNNLDAVQVDGSDYFACEKVFQTAVQRARKGDGPTLVLSEVVRLLPHSSSDDQRKYRPQQEIDDDAARDPLLVFKAECIGAKIATEEEFEQIDAQMKKLVDDQAQWSLEQPEPDGDTAMDNVFVEYRSDAAPKPPASTGDDTVMVDAINHALHEEMEANELMVVYGEDVADGKGGVFGATRGLSTKYGRDRTFNSSLAESGIIGTSIGLATAGFKPVVEIQFMDYIWPAMNQLKNELATVNWRSGGRFKAGVVVRTPVGGYIHGGPYHSQTQEAIFAHTPGLKVVFPSNAADAKGLLKAAIRGDDPVLFLEHKGLYRLRAASAPEPDADYILPLGHARTVKEGEDLTIVTWGLQVHKTLQALLMLDDLGISAEVIDLRTIVPWDEEAVIASVQKTGKAMVVHEDHLTCGFGAEIAARIADRCFQSLDGPIRRVAAADSPIPFNPELENRILPQVEGIAKAIRELAEY